MRTPIAHRNRRSLGFTLVELMVVIIVAAVLISIAVPTYSNSIRKSRRTEAKSALLDLAAREERYFSTHTTYSNDQINLGFSTTSGATTNVAVGSGYYQVSVCVGTASPCTGNATTGTVFLLTATPIGAQAKDTTCATFTLDNTGLQTSTDSSNTSQPTCWN